MDYEHFYEQGLNPQMNITVTVSDGKFDDTAIVQITGKVLMIIAEMCNSRSFYNFLCRIVFLQEKGDNSIYFAENGG